MTQEDTLTVSIQSMIECITNALQVVRRWKKWGGLWAAQWSAPGGLCYISDAKLETACYVHKCESIRNVCWQVLRLANGRLPGEKGSYLSPAGQNVSALLDDLMNLPSPKVKSKTGADKS